MQLCVYIEKPLIQSTTATEYSINAVVLVALSMTLLFAVLMLYKGIICFICYCLTVLKRRHIKQSVSWFYVTECNNIEIL